MITLEKILDLKNRPYFKTLTSEQMEHNIISAVIEWIQQKRPNIDDELITATCVIKILLKELK